MVPLFKSELEKLTDRRAALQAEGVEALAMAGQCDAAAEAAEDPAERREAKASARKHRGTAADARELADALAPKIEAAQAREVLSELLKRRAAMDRTLTAQAKEWAKIEPHLTAVADFGARYEQTRWEAARLNDELLAAGERRTLVNGATHLSRERGLESVQFTSPENIAHPNRFFHDLHIPAYRAGERALWQGKRS